jgi:transcriptional regulator with XRE-family HTH domain
VANQDPSPTESVDAQRRLLADRLRETREFLGLSQQEAADAAGLTRLAVSAIETGRRRIESVELSALAKVYRQPVTYFLAADSEVSQSPEVQFIARAASELTPEDRSELLRFAQFLKTYKGPTPRTGKPSDV